MEGAALISLVTPGGRQYWDRIRMFVGADIRGVLDRAKDIPPIWDVLPQYAPDETQLSPPNPEEEANA